MHYCALLITKHIPTDSDIENIMKRYNWDNIEEDENGNLISKIPTFTWDWYQVGGRYCGGIKLKIDYSDEAYRWKFYVNEDRNHRLFISTLLDTLKKNITPAFMYSEEKYFGYMGSGDNFLYVDGAKAKDILNIKELSSYICITPDGNAIARESYDGKNFIKDENYDKKFNKIIEENMDGFFTYIDIHD